MADNNGGPWGGGGSGGDKGNNNGGGNGRKPDTPQIPEIDELMRKGQEQLRVLMGGKGRGGGGASGDGWSGSAAWNIFVCRLAAVVLWLFASFYTVKLKNSLLNCFWVNLTKLAPTV